MILCLTNKNTDHREICIFIFSKPAIGEYLLVWLISQAVKELQAFKMLTKCEEKCPGQEKYKIRRQIQDADITKIN